MKSFLIITLLFIICSPLYAQVYTELTNKEIQFCEADSLLYYGALNAEPKPPYAGDTVYITGIVMNPPFKNSDPNNTETLSAGAPACYFKDLSVPDWDGGLLRDPFLFSDDFARLRTGDKIKVLVEVVEYFTTTQYNIVWFDSAGFLGNFKKPKPTLLTIDSFYIKGTNTPNFLAEKWEGSYVEFRNIMVSEPGVVGTGTFRISNSLDPSFPMIVYNKSNFLRTEFEGYSTGTRLAYIRGYIETRTGGQYGWYMINPIDSTDIGLRKFLLTNPSPDQIWVNNRIHEIKWGVIDDLIENVKIELSVDGGLNWIVITNNTTNDGSYEWFVPTYESTNCLLKISDIENDYYELMENYFTIRNTPTKPLITLQPQNIDAYEGENKTFILNAECFDSINYQWWQASQDGIGNIKLNNVSGRIDGVNTSSLTIIDPSIKDSSKQFYCTLANFLDPINLKTTSDTVQLNVNKSLFLNEPAIQEVVNVGSIKTITWNSNYDVGNIKIEYSIDNGNNWLEIANANSLNQSYNWLVPDNPSENCKIRIYSTTNNEIADYSEGTFTIFLLQSVSASISVDSDWIDEHFNGYANGNLDASESITNYGNILEFNWIINSDTVATGEDANIQLPTGTHKVILEIKTDQNIYDYDSVQISVYGAKLSLGASTNSSLSSYDNQFYYVNSSDNNIYSLDSNGFTYWTIKTDGALNTTPCVFNQFNIFSASETRLYSYNDVGIPNWDKLLGAKITSSPSIGPNEQICIGLENGRLYLIDLNGNILKSIQTNGSIYSSPAISDNGSIYFGSSDGNLYKTDFDGAIVNYFPTNDTVFSSPAIGKDTSIVIGSNKGTLFKLDDNLDLLWEFQTNGKIKSSPIIDSEGNIYFGTTEGKIFSLSQDGKVNWIYNHSSSIEADLSLDKFGNIYIGSNDGYLLAINNGNLLWQLKTTSKIIAAPLINPNGIIAQATTDGNIYTLKIPNYETSELFPDHQWPTYKGNNKRNGYVWDGITDVNNDENLIPTEYTLSQNYPNPFNPTTRIQFGLPRESKVSLIIYNILGQKVIELFNQQLKAGYHEVEFNSSLYSAGIYFYRLQAGDFVETKKMIFLK